MAYIQNKTRTYENNDIPLGFGAGMTFETNVGLFGVTLAVGRQQAQIVDFRNVKTHFGYVSLFWSDNFFINIFERNLFGSVHNW